MCMKKLSVCLSTLAAALLCACSTCEDKNNWQPLFGENLAEADYNPAVWSLSPDGVLSAEKDEIIFSKKDWENFELELEFKIFKDSNSGVVVYCGDTKKWIPNSIEIQIADNAKFPQPRTTCGSVYGFVPAEWDTSLPLDTWHKMRIRCQGKIIDTWLNGKHVSHMDMSKWTDNKTNPDGSPIPPWLAKNKKAEAPTVGKVGLQGKHGDAGINFKNVKIRQIADCK